MLKFIRVILAIVVVSLSSYGLINDNSYFLLPYMFMFLGCLMLVMSFEEFKKVQNSILGYILVGASLLCVYVSVNAFLFA